jgi:hypothetical protein
MTWSHRPFDPALLIAAGWCWRVLDIGNHYAVEDRRTGDRVVFPDCGDGGHLLAELTGLDDRDKIDGLAEEILDLVDQDGDLDEDGDLS